LSERLREGNVLMGSLQQRLALTDGSDWNKPSVIEADSTKRRGGESPAKASAKPKSKASKSMSQPATPKKGFFSRFFL
jgi:hypothetical protein